MSSPDGVGGNRTAASLLLAATAAALVIASMAIRGFDEADTNDLPISTTRFDVFCDRIVPILDRRCGNCHGVLTPEDVLVGDPPARVPLGSGLFRWWVDEGGRISALWQRRLAYDRCTDEDRIDRRNPALASPLARAALAAVYSGSLHPEVFATTDDPDYQTIVEWVEEELATDSRVPVEPSSRAERFFATEVTQVLLRNTCFGANCHGTLAFNDLKLDPGIPILDERFTPEMHHANRLAMLGSVTRLAHRSGDVERSKQLLKNIPVEDGGILHKGGNHFFAKDDPDYAVLARWLELEAEEACLRTGAQLGELRGVVFVRRPRSTPERFLEGTSFLPGGDLLLLENGTETNLTAHLHPDGEADIRAPDVSYDASQVAFAMRRSEAEPFNLWELELETGEARQLTFSEDPEVHFTEPLYAPDPDDTEGVHLDKVVLVFTSNLAGEWCETSPEGVLGEAEGGTPDTILDVQLTEKPGTFDGRVVRILRGPNAGEERTVARHAAGELILDDPLPSSIDSTTHYVIEAKPRVMPKFDAYRMRRAPIGQEREIFETTRKRMTYSVSQVRRPTMRSSGEVMFTCLRTGWQVDRPFFNAALFRTHVDGSNFHSHNGNRSGIPIFADDRELPNGLEIRIGQDSESWWGGMLILSDHQFGPTIEQFSPLDELDHPYLEDGPPSSLHVFFPGWIGLDPAVTHRGLSPGGAYRDPYPMPDGSILVSHAAGPVDLADPSASPDFDVVRLVPDPAFQAPDGLGPGSFRRETVVGGDGSELWARPVAARLKEPVRKKLKQEKDLFGLPEQVDGFSGYPSGTPSVLDIFDLPLLDSLFENVTPFGVRHLATPNCAICGEETPAIEQVAYARLIGARPLREGESGPLRRFIIAEVPVEEDGSLRVALPSEVAFDVQTLNPLRMALRSPNRWLYCHPGERHTLSIPRKLYAQTCSGCHGGITGDPVDTLRRPDGVTSASHMQAVWDAEKYERRVPMNWQLGGLVAVTDIDFERDLRPILAEKCADCHSGGDPAGGLDLAGSGTFQALDRYINQRESLAIESELLEKLLGRELHAAGTPTNDVPHPSSSPLSEDELLAFIRWIDLGATRTGGAEE